MTVLPAQSERVVCRIEDVDPSIEQWTLWHVDELCQQFGCSSVAEVQCPLCRAVLCSEHDSLQPVRRHDCLRGKAEAIA